MDYPSTSRSSKYNSQATNLAKTELAGGAAYLQGRNQFFWGKNQSNANAVTVAVKTPIPLPSSAKRKSDFTQTERKKKKVKGKSARSTVVSSRDTLEPTVLLKLNDLTARCSATHEGRKVLHERLSIRVDSLFNMLFSASPFLQSFHDRRKATDLCMGGWTRNSAGQNVRVLTVTVALQANLGPKTAKVTETQVMRECSVPGQLYSIDVQSVNEDIPYADTFVVQVHYCLRATVEQHTDVQVFAEVKFLKSVWAVVKVFIEKNAYAGLEEFCQSLYSAILNEIAQTH